MTTFTEIIDRWPSCQALAEDISTHAERVRKWRQRGNIPSPYWADLLAAARLRRYPITAEHLIAAASGDRNAAA